MPPTDGPVSGASRQRLSGLWAALTMLFAPAGLLYAMVLLRDAPPEHPRSATIAATIIGLAIVTYAMWGLRMGGIYWMTRVHLWFAGGLGAFAMALAFTGWFVHLREMPWAAIAPATAGVIVGAVVFRQYAMMLLLAIPGIFIVAMLASGA